MIIRVLLRFHHKITYRVLSILSGSLKKIRHSSRRKRTIQFILLFTFMLGMAGCNFFAINSAKEQLPTVSSLTPPKLPDWIEQISPIG
ncbi:MAG: hypothetical protein ACYT04_92575, partial [Nostoc sp.]